MIVATLGMVSKVEEYEDKKTGTLKRSCHVASGEHMISVALGENEDFMEFDQVVVSGELKSFERRFYINGGKIRLASPEDIIFLRGSPTRMRVVAPVVGAAQLEANPVPVGKGK